MLRSSIIEAQDRLSIISTQEATRLFGNGAQVIDAMMVRAMNLFAFTRLIPRPPVPHQRPSSSPTNATGLPNCCSVSGMTTPFSTSQSLQMAPPLYRHPIACFSIAATAPIGVTTPT
ncbi:hypothetical protein PM082_017690 [Marasmius tenuissimus]|nr:hypothetical protein PM082_017690 [Marasmius tenuissimus]